MFKGYFQQKPELSHWFCTYHKLLELLCQSIFVDYGDACTVLWKFGDLGNILNSSSNSTKDENFSFKAILVDMRNY
ncbi:hypothetical protein BpHYR1_006340 [Brachionus plicatilis]|uniref:Uncharacterized protein n=1 Tax=Brachionus plicatilis TaxID=10195 RepID=A0A3M7RIG9_BRAPC|nr:hypothetical protein BpHYR1_006340 [Brachionus plicatilis]